MFYDVEKLLPIHFLNPYDLAEIYCNVHADSIS